MEIAKLGNNSYTYRLVHAGVDHYNLFEIDKKIKAQNYDGTSNFCCTVVTNIWNINALQFKYVLDDSKRLEKQICLKKVFNFQANKYKIGVMLFAKAIKRKGFYVYFERS